MRSFVCVFRSGLLLTKRTMREKDQADCAVIERALAVMERNIQEVQTSGLHVGPVAKQIKEHGVIRTAQGAAPFDRGRRAGLNGVPKKPNPYDHPERQTGSTLAWERRCSEWDEGWSAGNAERQEQQKTLTP